MTVPMTRRKTTMEAPPAPRRHVLADHVGRGGVTLPATRPAVAGGGGAATLQWLALADLLITGVGEHALGQGAVAWRDGTQTWVRRRVTGHSVVLEERGDVAALAWLPAATDPGIGRFVWAWSDERTGEIVARGFAAPDVESVGVGVEGAMGLTASLRRPLLVRFVAGGVLTTRPAPAHRIEVGARVGPPQE